MRFNEDKYSNEFYHHFLDFIKNGKSVTFELEDAVRYLLYWKLGKISRKITTTSFSVPQADGIENFYYVSGTTPSNRKAFENALSKEILQKGLKFRDNDISYDTFKRDVDSVTKMSIVLPTFFIHIWGPSEFPILDIKVWRTYLWYKGKILTKYSKPSTCSHYEEYTTFYRDLVNETRLDWRVVDKDLWSLGDKVNLFD
jgi:hypothetical protein